MPNCPICNLVEAVVLPHGAIDVMMVNCGFCGKLKIDELLFTDLQMRFSGDSQSRTRLLHWLRKGTDRDQPVELTPELFERIVAVPCLRPASKPTT